MTSLPVKPDFYKSMEKHEEMIERIKSYFFYEVKCKESNLIRYNSSKKSLADPIKHALTQLAPVGESTAGKAKYENMSPKFFAEKEKFLNGSNFEFRALTMEDIGLLIGYMPDLSKTGNERSATRYLMMLLNDKAIMSL